MNAAKGKTAPAPAKRASENNTHRTATTSSEPIEVRRRTAVMNNLVETVVTFYGIDRATAERGAEMFLDVFPSLPAEFQILLIKHARSTVKVISAFEAQRAGAR